MLCAALVQSPQSLQNLLQRGPEELFAFASQWEEAAEALVRLHAWGVSAGVQAEACATGKEAAAAARGEEAEQQQEELRGFLLYVCREVLPACDLRQQLLLLQHAVKLVEGSGSRIQPQQEQQEQKLDLGMFVDALLLAVAQSMQQLQPRDRGSSSSLCSLVMLSDSLCSTPLLRQLHRPAIATWLVTALSEQLVLHIQGVQQQQHDVEMRLALQQEVMFAVSRAGAASQALDEHIAAAHEAEGAPASATEGPAAEGATAQQQAPLCCSSKSLKMLGETVVMLQATGEAVLAATAGALSQQHGEQAATVLMKRHVESLVLAAAALARCIQRPGINVLQAHWNLYALLGRLYESAAEFISRCNGRTAAATPAGLLTAEQAAAAAAEVARAVTSSVSADQLLEGIHRGLRGCRLHSESLEVLGAAAHLLRKIQHLSSPASAPSGAAESEERKSTSLRQRISEWLRSG
ncbi:hypothetical protein cyc_08745 [Cyclospora cayetanensis]|uniref:Uncharacterized protein n=1 Tax=Cyclospora cayetanensis TaxID=88456 RepID=A0A1D3DAF7_9EIME|nr:hypothetical protein cyc_08745 [Cyclospora cayetanensis]